MAVKIAIPTALRPYVGGEAAVHVEGDTVAAALSALTTTYPKLSNNLRDSSGKLRSFVNVYLNDEDIRFLPGREEAALKDGDTLTIVPSIAGGAR